MRINRGLVDSTRVSGSTRAITAAAAQISKIGLAGADSVELVKGLPFAQCYGQHTRRRRRSLAGLVFAFLIAARSTVPTGGLLHLL